MFQLRLGITQNISDEMARLRMLCFAAASPVRSSRDAFDDRSSHIFALIDGKLAAYGRLTPGPKAVFEAWTDGKAQIPMGPHVADLGRVCVAPAFRGLGLASLICLEALLLAAEQGHSEVVGAVIPGRGIAANLHAIGFRDSGPVVDVRTPAGNRDQIQPLVAGCGEADRWGALRTQKLDELSARGYELLRM